jgi:hypothetical protein
MIDAADRPRFDHWYEAEHVPDAVAAFKARRGWRCWSRTDPTVHFAFYEFENAAGAESVVGSPALQGMIAEFDRVLGCSGNSDTGDLGTGRGGWCRTRDGWRMMAPLAAHELRHA